jgi:WD40 repeat protein
VVFSPDGRYVLTGSGDYLGQDNTARLWDVRSGEEVRRFTGHEDPVVSVAFSPDGSQILTGSFNGSIRIWGLDDADFINFACDRIFRDLAPAERAQYGITDDAPTCPRFAPPSVPPTPTTAP